MGFRILHKRSLIAAALVLVSCSREAVPECGISIRAQSYGDGTKSLLGDSAIEDKVTGVTLAAYSGGKLYRCTYTSGNGTSIPFRLENGEDYTLYALVNTGDSRNLFPEFEADVPLIQYSLTSYNSGSTSVLSRGIPMAGWAEATSIGTAPVIPVRRLLAKVSAHVECLWPGATVSVGTIGNMNGRLRPFGESAMEGPADAFAYAPESHSAAAGSSANLVFYVPENRQGRVVGITSPEGKSHEADASVNAIRDCLTYMEILVGGNGLYQGEIRYRSYLGANSTDNFDIVGNCAYNWTLTYGEDGLGTDCWKRDNDLEDLRELQTSGPLYVIPGESVSLSDYVATNMPLGSIGWSLSANQLGDDLLDEAVTPGSLDGVSFIVDHSCPPEDYGNRVVSVYPKANPKPGLGGNMNVYVVDELISWRNTFNGKYFVTPGRQVDGDVDFRVSYLDDELRDEVTLHMKGKGGNRWTYSGGIYPTLLGDTGKDYDQVRFSPLPTTLPGDFPVTATTRDGSSASATIHVNDTRSIRWMDRSTKVPSVGNGFIGYKYLSENKIVVFLTSGGRYAVTSGEGFGVGTTPFAFIAGDRSIKTGDLSHTVGGVPFEGRLLLSSNYTDRIGISYDGPLENGIVINQITGKSLSGYLIVVPRVNSNLTSGTTYSMKVKALNGYSDATRHEIEAHIRVGDGYQHELALAPGISKVTLGSTVNLTATYYKFRVTDGDLFTDATQVLSGTDSRLTWSGAPGGVFTATEPGNFRIKATYTSGSVVCTGYADIEVTTSDVGVWSDWDNSGSIVLD